MVTADVYRDVKGWTPGTFGTVRRSDSVYFEAELKRALVDFAEPQSILELGFGNGAFGAWCHARSIGYAGTEADPELVRRAQAGGWLATNAQDALPAGPFTVIAAFDVFEHMVLDHLRSTLSDCRDRLGPTGRIIARFPSGDSPFSGAIYNGDLTHHLLLGSEAVRQLAAQASLKVQSIRSPALPLRGLGPVSALRRAGVASLSAAASLVIRIAFHGGQRTIISPNMVVVLTR